MSLIKYRLKRDFSKTNEPKAEKVEKKLSSQRFVVQRHQASHLHFDFRMEMIDQESGQLVLKSWAIPKNLPLEDNVKHLAIQTEDHPIGYLSFEGNIPPGNYGAGKVEIWDQGKWGLMSGSIEEGMLKFNLLGEKIKARYAMVRTKGFGDKQESDKDYWLIWKMADTML